MLHHQPQILSPLPEITQSSEAPSLRARKMSAAGNRSWSEEEESYLLQTRMQKMPYKHIALHLKKTELACRLHFHQLSHGSHRRRRTSSVSSAASYSSVGQSPIDHDNYSQSSRHSSPMSFVAGNHHIRSVSAAPSPGRNQHKILLPKPRSLTPQASPEPHSGLRINTEVAYQPKVVDTERLRSIYEARRQQFWATVAADYGADISAAHLEEIWRTGANAVRPPTPEASPDGSRMHNPVLPTIKPSGFYFQSSTPSEAPRHYSPMTGVTTSAVSTPERMPYMLPMPVPSTTRPRSGTWSSAPRDNMPIASLLTEDKNPRQY